MYVAVQVVLAAGSMEVMVAAPLPVHTKDDQVTGSELMVMEVTRMLPVFSTVMAAVTSSSAQTGWQDNKIQGL